MGTLGAKMVARPPAANVNMKDLEAWWKEISVEHGVQLRVTWDLSGRDDLAFWRFTVTAYRGTWDEYSTPLDQRTLVWPTASHKTVLGALLWLLITIDDSLTASAALAGLASAGL